MDGVLSEYMEEIHSPVSDIKFVDNWSLFMDHFYITTEQTTSLNTIYEDIQGQFCHWTK